jgi:hypothetical protein
MEETVRGYSAQRAETLAREFLTRSPEVELHTFDSRQIDFILTLRPHPASKPHGFMAFGAIVKGTERELVNEQVAARYLTTHISDQKNPKAAVPVYFLPMLGIVYSMKSNVGYYAWVSKPKIIAGKPMLLTDDVLDCQRINKDSLNEIIDEIRLWYDHLAASMIVEV